MIGKPKKKLETSKIVLFSVLIFCAVYLVMILCGWLLFDRMDAAGLAGVICTPAGISIAFYSWKAKNENTKKYGYKPQEDETEDIAG